MERQSDDTLLKARGYRATIAVGFRFYAASFRRLFKASWLMVLLYALASAVCGTLATVKVPEMVVTLFQQLTTYQGFTADTFRSYALLMGGLLMLALGGLALLALATATVLQQLKTHQETGAVGMPARWLSVSPRLMGRTAKGVLFSLLLSALPLLLVCMAVAAVAVLRPEGFERHAVTIGCTAAVVLLAIVLLALPLWPVFMKYVLKAPRSYWQTLRQDYGVALRQWGYLFVVTFLSTLAVGLVSVVITLPNSILTLANQAAQVGRLTGDPLGMPAYMTVLTAVTFLLSSFIQFYALLPLVVHQYFAYGAIEARETERRQSGITTDTPSNHL